MTLDLWVIVRYHLKTFISGRVKNKRSGLVCVRHSSLTHPIHHSVLSVTVRHLIHLMYLSINHLFIKDPPLCPLSLPLQHSDEWQGWVSKCLWSLMCSPCVHTCVLSLYDFKLNQLISQWGHILGGSSPHPPNNIKPFFLQLNKQLKGNKKKGVKEKKKPDNRCSWFWESEFVRQGDV